MKKLILIGAGGHCISCIEVINSKKEYEILGILEKNAEIQSPILGYPILGNDDLIPELAKQNYEFLITVGQIKSPKIRIQLFDSVKKSGGRLATVIASSAYVSKNAEIGEGTIIMHQSFVNSNVIIGNNCIINTKAVLEHEVILGNNCHLSVNAILNGAVSVEDNCFIGSNAVLYQSVTIVQNSLIGAGSIIRKSIKHEGVYFEGQSRKSVR